MSVFRILSFRTNVRNLKKYGLRFLVALLCRNDKTVRLTVVFLFFILYIVTIVGLIERVAVNLNLGYGKEVLFVELGVVVKSIVL